MDRLEVTKDILGHWLSQDKKKLGWWVDLVLLSDNQGVVHMNLTDLADRWETSKPTVHRFISRLCEKAICETIVKRQGDIITVCKSESCKGSKNEVRNDCETAQESPLISLSPTPPIPFNPKEYYNQSLNNAHAREEKVEWVESKEMSFKAQFQAEGRIMASARKTGCDAIGINNYLERFMAHCQSVDFGHTNIGHFGAHFNKFVEKEKSKPLQTNRDTMSTLDWNTQIAIELGLMNEKL